MPKSNDDHDDSSSRAMQTAGSGLSKKPTTVIAIVIGFCLTAGSLIYSSYAENWQPPKMAFDAVSNSAGFADESSCVACHTQADSFHQTGHAQTLHRAADPFSRSRLESFQTEVELSHAFDLEISDGVAMAITRDDGMERRVELDWCFGSGIHAHTWTSTLSDARGATDLLEFRWTWFDSLDGFAVTPGQSSKPPPGSIVSMGVQFDGPKAERCFSCHATTVPMIDGRIDESEIRPGVTCQRCHGPMADHVASAGERLGSGWKPSDTIDRMEAVQRCGVCHRMPEERDPHEIRAGNLDIVRFQPMGLLQSRCFLESQMTCTTCHDPHRPLDNQDSQGIWQCVQCHSPEHVDHTLCKAGMSDNCLDCHMPSLKMEFPVSFTDHWIRIKAATENVAGREAADE